MKKSILILCVVIAGLAGIWLVYSTLARQQAEEEREDLVWMARRELNVQQADKTIAYLRLIEMKYEDQLLKLGFSSWPSGNATNDSAMWSDFSSMVAMYPGMWRKVANYLQQAEVDMQLTFNSYQQQPSLVVGSGQLSALLDDEQMLSAALNVFILKKKQEVLYYAAQHFHRTPYFRVEQLEINGNCLALQLSYDETVAVPGASYLDNTRVNPEFTDAVGDMGSILDGMLAICLRKNLGFAFEYKARKKKTIKRVEWDAQQAREIHKETSEQFWYRDRPINQVHTVVVKER